YSLRHQAGKWGVLLQPSFSGARSTLRRNISSPVFERFVAFLDRQRRASVSSAVGLPTASLAEVGSTILAAVARWPMSPSTRATLPEAATSVDWVVFRELATTLKPRSTNVLTMPAPMPCEAPVTMAVFRGLFIVFYLENVLSSRTIDSYDPSSHSISCQLGSV